MGIGTTSPSYKLDVNGGAQFNTNTGSTPFYITRLGSTDQALSIKVMDDNVRFESIQDEAADSYGGFDFRMDGGATEPNFTIRKNSADPILHVDGSGNVGIGTTTPSDKLHVVGASRLQKNGETLNLVGTDHVYSAWYPRGTSGGRKAYMGYGGANTTDFTAMNQDTGAFIIGTNNAERMRIISNGNVKTLALL
jgi:hypothetical protein